MLVEAQSWWTPEGGRTMHVHVGGDWPIYGPHLSGEFVLPVRLQLHHASGHLDVITCTDAKNIGGTLLVGDPHSAQVEASYDVVVDSRSSRQDGWNDLRVQTTFRDTDGSSRAARVVARVFYENGFPVNEKEKIGPLIAHSWPQPSDADGRGYSNAQLHGDSIPTAPVSGLWEPRVAVGSSKSGHVRHMFVSIDPAFHSHDPSKHKGLVVYEERERSRDFIPVQIDTTQLPNGPHKLFIKASDEGMFPGGTIEGALVVGFNVEN